MNRQDQERIRKIALHRYGVDAKRLQAATNLDAKKPRDRRFVIDSTGQNTKIVRTPDMDLLLCAYVTRRVVCAGRLLVLFGRLRKEAQDKSPVPQPVKQWSVTTTSAVVQVANSVGGEGYTQACHTAPCQVLVAGHYPWTLARSLALKQEFVTCFGDIYVMPDTVNETDSFIERPAPTGLDNRGLFATAVASVLNEGRLPIDVLPGYLEQLRERIAVCSEYLFDGVHKDWVLGVYVQTLATALPLAQLELPLYAASLPHG
jgi:hypothetical protein